jgi:Cu2+-exporting ATPase
MASNHHQTATACEHCRSPLPAQAQSAYCCAGCEAVAALLRDQGLTRYYALAPASLPPVGKVPAAESHAWLEPLVARAEGSAGGELCALELDVQGIHCAACVWMMNELFRRAGAPAGGITINPALGKARLVYRPGHFDAVAWVREVERFGYRFGPSRKRSSPVSNGLALRLGLSVALTMNVMLFSISFYVGLSAADGPIYRLFTVLAAVLASAVVVIGGGVFIRAALLGLRRRILHLDFPIALGVVAVYTTSMVRLLRGQGGELAYFDTLCTFITLMLVGRWASQRVVDRNRRFLLEDDGARGIFVRRLEAGRPRAVAIPLVGAGDRLLIAPGELVPVDARLAGPAAAISTDWITGEPAPRAVSEGGLVPAGSFNAGRSPFAVVAETDFAGSPLVALLRQTTPLAGGYRVAFWDRLARRWVVQVLAVATAGLILWWPRGAGAALDVAVSLLVVTCPCAIGIALPLAYEVTQSALRRAGFFVRAGDLLDRLVEVRTLIFDKTGTLTLGRLALEEPGAIDGLDAEERTVAYNLACRSNHPAAGCLARALDQAGAHYDDALEVTEVPGDGLACRRGGAEWRLGRASWAGAPDGAGTVLSRDGQPRARFAFREVLRPDAAALLRALRDDGYQVHLLSGDQPARVAALAGALDLPAGHARGGLDPAAKARAVAELDHRDTLYLGDGINDSLAFDQALCAGTVAVERPVVPGKAAFFLAGEGLEPLRRALGEARRLRRVVRRVSLLSLSYNVVAVSLCLAGVMSPLRAAVTMPLSSVGILLFTLAQLRAPRAPRPIERTRAQEVVA